MKHVMDSAETGITNPRDSKVILLSFLYRAGNGMRGKVKVEEYSIP